jgi:type IV pilus assembly protein PilN
MIKINLLPVRAVKKKETAKQQIFIFIISVVGVLLIAVAIYSVTLAKIGSAKAEIGRSEEELQRLKTKIGEIDNIKKLQAEVKKKLDVLNQLRKEKTGPANRLGKLSDVAPDKLWLTKYAETGGNVSIAGIAFNEDLIADFMRSLQASGEFANVELMVSEQTEISGVKLKRFEITCSIKSLKKEEPAAAQKK